MKALLAPVAVVAFFIAGIAIFGGVILALGKGCQAVVSDCLDWPGAALLIGLSALAAALAFARYVVTSVGSARRH